MNEQGAIICKHIYEKTRPVLLVSHDSDIWSFMCGGYDHEESTDNFSLVGLDHLLDDDPSLNKILNLSEGWEAERQSINDPWVRSINPSEES